MLLSRLQDLIGGIYDVSIAHDVYDFLVTDRGRLPHAARSGTADEELLVAQPVAGRESLPVPRLECRPRPAGVAARAGDAGRGRQVRGELLAAAPAVSRTLPGGIAARAVRAHPHRSEPDACARRAVSRGEPLCGEILPAPRTDTVAHAGSPGAGWWGE